MANNYENLPIDDLVAAEWISATYVVKPDKIQLRDSIAKYGILSPIVINMNNIVIDGYNRLDIATSMGIKTIPVVRVDVEGPEAILLHIDLNRYRGIVVAKYLSELIINIIESYGYDPEQLRRRMKLTQDEFAVLESGSLIKMRKIKQHTYSPAWVPIESSTGEDIQIERPTGHKEQV